MKRPKQHVMEDKSGDLLRQLIPAEWIVRSVPKDYGVDLEIELVEQPVVTGKRIWVQMKSVEQLSVRTAHDACANRVEYVPFSLSTKEIRYALECPFPLLLFLADLRSEEIYWLPIRDEVESNLGMRTPNWQDQASNTLRIPKWNSLSSERRHKYPGLRWYALEPFRTYALAMLHHYLQEFHRTTGSVVYSVSHGKEKAVHSSFHLARQYLSFSYGLATYLDGDGAEQFGSAARRLNQLIIEADALVGNRLSRADALRLLSELRRTLDHLSTNMNLDPFDPLAFTLNDASMAFLVRANKRKQHRKN